MTFTTSYLTTRKKTTEPREPERRESLVVVGNGPVGFGFLEKMVRLDSSRHWEITVFGEESTPAYDRIRLTQRFHNSSAGSLDLASREWYAENGITLHTGDPVIGIDRKAQVVHSLSGLKVHYHRLVLATGSRPVVPPIEGIKQSGVYVYRTLRDVEQIVDSARKSKTAVVLGSGLLGLEAAHALLQLGLETHVVEMAATIMPKQLDNSAAEILQEKLEKLGLQFHLLHRTGQITKSERGLEVSFDRRSSLNCDMLVVAAGIRPRDELASGCELEVSPRGGIVVNDKLETSDPRIYGIGECVVHRGIHYGLVAPGHQMADALAKILTHGSGNYEGSDVSTRLKLMGVDVCTFGRYLESGPDFEQLAMNSQGRYRKLILERGRIVGAMLVGESPEVSRLHQAVLKEERIWGWQRKRFERTGHVWRSQVATHISQWPGSAIVCNCMHVTKERLTDAEHEGISTLEQLCAVTKAGTVCGSCRPLLISLLGETSTEVIQKSRGLLTVSLLTVAVLVIWSLVGSIKPADSVLSSRFAWEAIWRESFYQQLTGYTALGFVVIGLTFSLRKRWSAINIGGYGAWRLMHAVLGIAALLIVMLHTGMHVGSAFNFSLMVVFLGASLSGSLLGIATSLEQDLQLQTAAIKKYRRYGFGLHVMLFWPLPVLVVFHVISVYFFSS